MKMEKLFSLLIRRLFGCWLFKSFYIKRLFFETIRVLSPYRAFFANGENKTSRRSSVGIYCGDWCGTGVIGVQNQGYYIALGLSYSAM
jgi:hypothetical protein